MLAILLLARPVVLYLVVPIVGLLLLVVLVSVLRLHPLIGGIIFAVGIAVGLAFYFDEILEQ